MTAPRIVILDGFTLNPGDNPWTAMNTLGNVEIYDHSTPEQAIDRCRNATIVVVNKTRLDITFFRQSPSVRFVAVSATGWDCVDGSAAREFGVAVANVPVYGTDSVAQFTLALILELCSHVGLHHQAVQAGEWTRAVGFSFWNRQLLELSGMTLGLIGFGRIGRRTGELAHAFGMKVLACSETRRDKPTWEPFAWSELDELLQSSDIVSLHCPLTSSTRGMINRQRLNLMQPHAMLINTARGGLVSEPDLADALNSGRLAAAALDVVSQEPIRADNPLLTAKNCLITPHIAWAALAARRRLLAATVSNVASFLSGSPANIVNSA